jgi:hypothetical protein
MKALWNILFSLFFLVLVIDSFVYLAGQGKLVADIPLLDLVLMALATFRLVRLFTYDHITAFLRDWLAPARSGTFFGTVNDLLRCPWCTGVWFSFLIYVGYALARPEVMPLILILAIAALASFFQIFANLVGWNAEGKKLDVTHKGE